MRVVSLASILADVRRRPAANGVRLVGIDGPSGAGKSTLARRLAGLAGAPLVAIDDFTSWNDFAGWWPRFETSVLDPLSNGRAARFQARDWEHDEFGDGLAEWKTVAPAPLVVIDGVTCLRRAAAGRLTYGIWVQAPPDTCFARGLERDGAAYRTLWERWKAWEAAFLAADRPWERADLVVDTASDVPHDPEREVIVPARRSYAG